ncbi:hypothetical protein HYY70_05775 [Candidatus Woesearchaeota archaeon]|nr:hypothetical protein [Candidatus Woesearchaeota archaeon]
MLGDYFWDVGLSLAVAGAILFFTNPLGIFIAGIILFLVAVVIKSINKKKN